MDLQTLCKQIEARKQELFELLSDLVKINSENFGSYGNEAACARYIRQLCEEMGLEAQMYSPMELPNFENHPDYFPGRHLEDRYNVTAVWKGKEERNKLMLMGHLDTVEIGNPANWEKDPLSGEIADGRVWGRGSGDDKYAIAVMLFLVRLLKDAGFEPKENLLLNAYCDEELGGSHGALAAVLKDPCAVTVNMDGRINQIWHCASGGQVVAYRYRMRGTCDSAERTARALPVVLNALDGFGKRRRAELEANPYYAGTNIPATSMRYNHVYAGNNDMDKHIGVLQFTFYTDKTKDAIWEELAQLDQQLAKLLDSMGIDSLGFEPKTRFFHYAACPPESKAILDLCDAAMEADSQQIQVCGSCLSDLSVILKYGGGEVFGFGSGRHFGEHGGPHQPNEWIRCDTMVSYAKTIGAYILKLLG